MPPSMLWHGRRPLYRLNLAVLLSLTPVNLLGMLLPYWLETKVEVTSENQVTNKKEVFVNYGIWRQCTDDTGCIWVHDEVIDADVGGWMYPITVFMLLSSLCHLSAAILGGIQNFLPREYSRHVRWKMFKKVLHRDAPFAEDIGFLAGFFGTLSCIIFMLSTKDQISDGAHYQWAFAFAFLSSTLTVMASLTLTKTHLISAPRPPNTHHLDPWGGRNDVGEEAAASSSSPSSSSSPHPLQQRPLRPVRAEDVQLEDRGDQAAAAQAARRSSSRRREAHSRFSSSSSSTRRRSRSRSRSRERSGSHHPMSRQQQQQQQQQQRSGVPGQSRLVRSPEVENIPAAITPSSSFQCPPVTEAAATAGPFSRSRSAGGPVLCLEMSDLQVRASTSQPELARRYGATASAPSSSATSSFSLPSASSRPPVSDSRSGDSPTSSGRVPTSYKKPDSSSSSSDPHRTQPEVVLVVSPPSEVNAGAQGDHSVTSASGIATDDDSAAFNIVMTERL